MSKRTFYIIYIIYSTLIDRDAYFVFFRIVENYIHSYTLPAAGTAKFLQVFIIPAASQGQPGPGSRSSQYYFLGVVPVVYLFTSN